MKRLFSVSAVAVAALATPVLAADAPAPVYAAPPLADAPVALAPFNWRGFYVGAHVGYGWGDNTANTALLMDGVILENPPGVPVVARNSFDLDGWLAGGQIGFNWQVDQLVLGIEGDASWSNIDGSFQFDQTRPEAIAGADIDWLATLRGRVGVALDRTLIYATGGVAWAKVNGFANNVWDSAPAVDRATASGTRTGWTAGAGVEHAVTDNLTIKAEYLYVDLGSDRGNLVSSAYPDGVVLRTDSDLDLHSIRAGLNFRFAGF